MRNPEVADPEVEILCDRLTLLAGRDPMVFELIERLLTLLDRAVEAGEPVEKVCEFFEFCLRLPETALLLATSGAFLVRNEDDKEATDNVDAP